MQPMHMKKRLVFKLEEEISSMSQSLQGTVVKKTTYASMDRVQAALVRI